MIYIFYFYAASALLSALVNLKVIGGVLSWVGTVPTRTPTMDEISIAIIVLILIFVPVINTLVVLAYLGMFVEDWRAKT